MQVPLATGGAELHAAGLRKALEDAGHEADIVTLPFKGYPPQCVLDSMAIANVVDLTDAFGTRIDWLIGLKFPAYYARHPKKSLWVLHQHRAAYDLWNTEYGDLHRFPEGYAVRRAIERADRELFASVPVVYANSQNVARRLSLYCGAEAVALYHPPPYAGRYFTAEAEDYLLFPSRLSAVKRQDLALEALAQTRHPVRIEFLSISEESGYADRLRAKAVALGVTERIRWLGPVPLEVKLEKYARAVAVVFPPHDEDLGYVTLEAMLAAKPVITCVDSGGPTEFVLPWRTGLIAEPAPAALAEAMDTVWENRPQAAFWGRRAREYYASLNISWANVVATLL